MISKNSQKLEELQFLNQSILDYNNYVDELGSDMEEINESVNFMKEIILQQSKLMLNFLTEKSQQVNRKMNEVPCDALELTTTIQSMKQSMNEVRQLLKNFEEKKIQKRKVIVIEEDPVIIVDDDISMVEIDDAITINDGSVIQEKYPNQFQNLNEQTYSITTMNEVQSNYLNTTTTEPKAIGQIKEEKRS
ncbi:hypothetical protein QTN25_009674 [Entamoeba marina]